jgi:solute carrier family 25 carnitine/acylcarnitine transporter 20/29
LQTQNPQNPQYTGIADVVSKIVKNEGPLAFYKGSLAPFLGAGVRVSILFGVVEKTKRLLQGIAGTPGQLSLPLVFMSGSIAGIAISPLSTITEHIRIKLQLQKQRVGSTADVAYSGSIDAFKKIKNQYGWTGAFKGYVPTLMRESIAMGCYFWTYELVLRQLKEPWQKKKDVAIWKFLLSGGCAGLMLWWPVYPIDVLKSKIQSDALDKPKFAGVVDCVKKTLASEGPKAFAKGLLPCTLRALPVNMGNFLVLEMSMLVMGSNANLPDEKKP